MQAHKEQFLAVVLAFVLLKRAEDALRDGDHIYSMIRGCCAK